MTSVKVVYKFKRRWTLLIMFFY